MLRSAKSIQTRLGNRIGLARTWLLEARLASMKVTANRRRKAVLELCQQVPDLRRCRLLSRILDRWSDWAGGWRAAELVTEHGDLFWLL